MRRNLTNLVLLLVLVGLGLVVYFEPGLQPKPEAPRLTPLRSDDISHIQLQRPGKGSLTLQREGEHWFIHGEPSIPAAEFHVRGLLRLAQEQALRHYPAKDLDPAKLDLLEQRPEVIFNKQYRVRFGGTDPLDDQRFVQVGDQILVIQNLYQHQVEADLGQWIDPHLLPEDSQLQTIKLPQLTLERDAQGHWQLTPEQTQLTSDQLAQLAQQWQNSSAIRVQVSTTEVQGEKITITTVNPEQRIEFLVKESPEEVVFQRQDLGVSYTLTPESAQGLLHLSPAEVSTPEPASLRPETAE